MSLLIEKVSARGLHYRRLGSGRPVLLLHGWCLNRGVWTYLEEDLLHDFDVISPDLAGFGLSAGLAGPYDLDRMAADALALIAELGLEDVVVIGFAFGAAVAMTMAVDAPGALGGAVLIGTPSAAAAAYDRMPRAMRKDWPLFAERSATAICRRPQSAATLHRLSTMFGATSLPVAIETVGVLGQFEPLPLAEKMTMPTLYVHGADDDVVPLDVSRACAREGTKADVAVVEDCGHLVVLDRPAELAALVRGFLAGL